MSLSLKVDGNEIKCNEFVENFIYEVLCAIAKSFDMEFDDFTSFSVKTDSRKAFFEVNGHEIDFRKLFTEELTHFTLAGLASSLKGVPDFPSQIEIEYNS